MPGKFIINYKEEDYEFSQEFGYFLNKEKIRFCGKCLIPETEECNRIVSPLFEQAEITSTIPGIGRYTLTAARWICNICNTFYIQP